MHALREITADEEEAAKYEGLEAARLLGSPDLRSEARSSVRWSLGRGPAQEVRRRSIRFSSSESGPSQTPNSTADFFDIRSSLTGSSSSGNDDEETCKDNKKESSLADGRQAIRHFLNVLIDDTIFFREGHTTLRQHRQNDSIRMLFFKSIASQTTLLLSMSCTLQFAVNRSIVTFLSVTAVTVSLSAFPHVPWRFWTMLQSYNLVIIFLKLTIQLPIFCSDGSLRVSSDGFSKLRSCPACSKESVPFMSVLGFAKVQKPSDERGCFAVPSYSILLGPD